MTHDRIQLAGYAVYDRLHLVSHFAEAEHRRNQNREKSDEDEADHGNGDDGDDFDQAATRRRLPRRIRSRSCLLQQRTHRPHDWHLVRTRKQG